MSLLDKILLRIFSFLTVVFALVVALLLLDVTPVVNATRTVFYLGGNYNLILFGVYLILGLRYLLFPLEKRKMHSFVKDTEVGEIRISHATVKEIAVRAARHIRGVDRVITHVEEYGSGLIVHAQVRATAGIDLTAMSTSIQQQISEAIYTATSLKVSAVHVQIAELTPEVAQR